MLKDISINHKIWPFFLFTYQKNRLNLKKKERKQLENFHNKHFFNGIMALWLGLIKESSWKKINSVKSITSTLSFFFFFW